MTGETVLVKCAGCGARNRVLKDRTHEQPVCGKCGSRLSLSHKYSDLPIDVTERNFQEEILSFPGAAAVEFCSPGCGYCRSFDPVFQQLAGEYQGKIKFARLDISANPNTASRYRIEGTPTLVMFFSGQERDRLSGAVPKQTVQYHLNSLLRSSP